VAPTGRGQQLDLLGNEQRPEFHGEALDEFLVGEYRRPVRATVGIVVELPQVDEMVILPNPVEVVFGQRSGRVRQWPEGSGAARGDQAI